MRYATWVLSQRHRDHVGGDVGAREDQPGARVEEIGDQFGDDWTRIVTEVQHLTYQPRVMWCSRHGSGFGCDREGEWHSHWHGVRHNPASDCCHTVAMPVWEPSTGIRS